jgi:xylulokinase
MYLGIDCGTQGSKALLMDANGKSLGRGYAPHALIERSNGAREQEPQWWVEALVLSVRQALAQAKDNGVLAVGVSGQQHGLVVLDKDLQVIRPAKLWNDTETAPQNAEIIDRLGGPAACFEQFGIIPLTGYTVSKLLWLKQHEPENFARIRHILLPHEYLNFWLTGKLFAEYGDASGTAFFDVRKRQWAEEVLNKIDGGSGHLLRALPPLLDSSQIIGSLRSEAAETLGLPRGCVVSTGGGDNMMGAIGTGNVREGVVTLSLGTSSTVYTYTTQPSTVSSADVAPFCSSSGGWLPLVCTMNATNVVTQTLNVLGKTVADIEEALLGTTPGADGLCFVPFLNGERTPDLPTARGSIVGMSASNFTAANLIRAVIEGA